MRLTRKNPNGSYRIPMSTQKTLRLEWQQEELTVFGEVANLLGAWYTRRTERTYIDA